MSINDFYVEIEGNYEEVLGRLGKDERIVKYVKRFAQTDYVGDFEKAYADKNGEEAFRALHSIKGMCLNLGLGKLTKSSSNLCEEFRNGLPTENVDNIIELFRKDYADTVECVKRYFPDEEA